MLQATIKNDNITTGYVSTQFTLQNIQSTFKQYKAVLLLMSCIHENKNFQFLNLYGLNQEFFWMFWKKVILLHIIYNTCDKVLVILRHCLQPDLHINLFIDTALEGVL